MKILYFELRKEFIRKSFVIVFALFTVINLLWMEWDYRTNGGFTEDFVKIKSTEKENEYYEELHQKLDGKLDTEKVTFISDEYQKYYNWISSGKYSTEYDEDMHTGYVFGDYSLIANQFYNPIKYLVTYKEANDQIVECADENMALFTEKGNTYEIERNRYISKHYKDRNPLAFYETSGWKHLFSYDKSDVLILIMLLIGIMPSFFKEKDSGMEIIQKTSVFGRKNFLPMKFLAHIFMAMVLEMVFGLLNYIMISLQYGLDGPQMMLYSIEEYQYTPWNINMLEFYMAIVLSKCVGFSILAIIMTIIARLVKNAYATFLIMLSFLVGALYLSGFQNGSTALEKFCTLISPFSLIKVGEMAKSMHNLEVCGHFFMINSCIYGVQILLIILALFIMYWFEKRGKVIR